jgi:hypothetical protein
MPAKVRKRILYGLPVLLVFVLAGFGVQVYYLKDNFRILDLTINTQTPALWQKTEITAQIRNISLRNKTYEIEFFVNDELVETQRVNFGARETKAVNFNFREIQTPGTYKLRVSDTEIAAVITAGAQPFLAPGDEWDYILTRGGLTHRVKETITRESIIDKESCWLRLTSYTPALDLRFDTKEECTSKQHFYPIRSELVGTVSNQVNNYRYEILPLHNIFPLEAGQIITLRRNLNSHTQFFDTGINTKKTTTRDTSIFVAGMERITVRAGTFDAFHLEYKSSDGQLILEEWRAPQIKLNVVKSVNPITREVMELESYKIR